jgi:restriction system protein
LFLKRNFVAVGWVKIGDLLQLGDAREAFKAAVAEAYPEKKPGAIPNNAGQLYRFAKEMRPGDLVLYPSKRVRKVHLGQIKGDYRYDPSGESNCPHRRPVTWLKHCPRTQFSQGALYEIDSALSLFQVKNYADEFRAAIEGKHVAPEPTEDESAAVVAEDIERNTRDFIIKTLAQELKGHRFTDLVAHVLNLMRYRTRVAPEGPDGGVDIIAHRDELGFEPPPIKVQVKSSESSIGAPIVQALYGNVDASEFGLLVTLGSFTNQAKNFAKGKSNLRLIDAEELVELILGHYDEFDPTYKGVLPLPKVYVPQPVTGEEE